MSFGSDLDKQVNEFFKNIREQDKKEVEEFEEITPIETVIELIEPIVIPRLPLMLPAPQVILPDEVLEEELTIEGTTFEMRIFNTLMKKAKKMIEKDIVKRVFECEQKNFQVEKYVSTFLDKELFLKEFPISEQVYNKLVELEEVKSLFQQQYQQEGKEKKQVIIELIAIKEALLLLLIDSNPLLKAILFNEWSCTIMDARKLLKKARGTIYKMIEEGNIKIKGEIRGKGVIILIGAPKKIGDSSTNSKRKSLKIIRNDDKSIGQAWEIDLLALCKFMRKKIRMNAGLRYNDPRIEELAIGQITDAILEHGFTNKKRYSYPELVQSLLSNQPLKAKTGAEKLAVMMITI